MTIYISTVYLDVLLPAAFLLNVHFQCSNEFHLIFLLNISGSILGIYFAAINDSLARLLMFFLVSVVCLQLQVRCLY